MKDAALAGWLRLDETPGLDAATAALLVTRFGSPAAVFDAAARGLVIDHDDPFRSVALSHALATPPPTLEARLDAARAWLESGCDRSLVAIDEAEYPFGWRDLPDAPLLAHVRGSLAALSAPALAIVGSRNASVTGCAIAREYACAAARAGLVIVSGLALGIDAAAHEGALDAGCPTVAVFGTGCDRVYPGRHRHLAARIVEQGGALVSASPLGTRAHRWVFPRRNRLIAAQSRGVFVVEAALASGSLITAHQALDLGREVFALPGSIHSPLSKGCHRLIKEGAHLVDDLSDLLEPLGFRSTAAGPTRGSRGSGQPGDFAWSAHGPFTLDEAIRKTGRTAPALLSDLALAELDGRLERLPGGRWMTSHGS